MIRVRIQNKNCRFSVVSKKAKHKDSASLWSKTLELCMRSYITKRFFSFYNIYTLTSV